MKKTITILLAIFMLMSLFAGCQQKASNPANNAPAESAEQTPAEKAAPNAEEPIEITFMAAMYSDKTEANLRSIIDAFEAEHPNVHFTLEVVGWSDMLTRTGTVVSAKQAPDLYNGTSVASYIEDGLVYNVKDIASPELIEDFYPTFWENNKIPETGEVYQLPYLASIQALFCNKKIFDEVGLKEPPKTWTEIEETCAKIDEFYNGAVYPYYIGAVSGFGDDSNIAFFGWNNGGGYADKDGNFIVNCPENVEALTWMKSLYDKGWTNKNPTMENRDDMQKVLVENKLAMMISSCFFPTLYPDTEMLIGTIPYNDKTMDHPVSSAVQDCLAVFNEKAKGSKDTPEKLAAIREFLDFFYAPENYVPLIVAEGMLPANISGAKQLAAQAPEQAAYLDALEGARFHPRHLPNWTTCGQLCSEAVQKILTNMSTPQEALDEVQAALEAGN